MTERHEFADELVETIHAAMLGETDWQTFVDRLNGVATGALSTLFFHDLTSHRGAVAYVAGTEGRESALRDYEGYFSGLNPWMRNVAATPIGRGVIGEQIVSRAAFNSSEYYNDYVRPNGLETGIGLTLFKDDRCYFVLSTLTGDHDIDRNLERADILTQIAPSLDQVFRFYRSSGFRAAALDLGEGIGSAVNMSFMLVNDDLRVVRSSSRAEYTLASGDPVGLDPLGRVRFRSAKVQEILQRMLLRRQTEPSQRVFSDTLSGIKLIRVGGGKAAEFFSGPMVAILIGNTDDKTLPDLSELAQRYRLTAAEIRVFNGVLSGNSITSIAQHGNVAPATVRTQLKSIYGKTGVSSQTELIRLAVGLKRRS